MVEYTVEVLEANMDVEVIILRRCATGTKNTVTGYLVEGREEVQMDNMVMMMVVGNIKDQEEDTVYW